MGSNMGTRSTSIYESDIALDIKTDYMDALSVKMSNEEA
jgi:hypothetical protein